ncbi:MAG: glycosyltransferase [Bacteroidetes bacterium]|nr:glycosyltransferase [Bacteroidota bacterium]MCL5026451.1 glycosyltransferase [Chloroflexota bacterium]
MQGRADLYRLTGGDTTKVEKTAEAVRRLGAAVDISVEPAPDLAGYDLVHVFSSTDDPVVCRQGLNARQQGVPLAVSTIYWNNVELLGVRTRYGRFRILHRLLGLKNTTRLRGFLWRRLPAFRRLRSLFAGAGVLMPDSRRESDLVRRDFGLPPHTLVMPVVNAIDTERFARPPSADAFVSRYGRSGFALCVGRLEVRKNQIALLQAAAREGFPLVLVGVPNPKEPGYVAECRRMMEKADVLWLPRIAEEELYSAYATAAVHVLPSWWETTGLVSLEAGATGCPLVCSDRGPIEEYFGDMAVSCDPADVADLGRAVVRQMQAGRSERLRQHILSNFGWDVSGRQTLAAYHRLLSGAR